MTGHIQTSLMMRTGSISWQNWTNTKSNAWERTPLSVTVPAGWQYIAYGQQGWNNGRPIGIGLDSSSALTTAPAFLNEIPGSISDSSVMTVVGLLSPGTYYLYSKRTGTGSNGYAIYYIAFPAAWWS